MEKVVTDVNNNRFIRSWKPGPKPKRYVKVLVNVPVEHLEIMRIRNEETGGCDSVSAQIRTAIRGHLCGLIYISLLKT
ncbi:MAG: hypothetical protein HY864_00935 [Chloroflexi bacterium]|nr:hypothetical protein [Chloroflexota bacterium]